MKLVQTRWKWKCQWRISGLARKQNAEKSRRQLQGGVDVSRSEPAGPKIPLLCLWIRHSEINDAPPNIPRYPATKIRYTMTRCRHVQKRACGPLSPPIACREKNDEKNAAALGSSGFGLCRSFLPSLQSLCRREFLAGHPRDGQCHGRCGRSGAGAPLRVIGGCLCRGHRLEGRGG